MRDPTNINFLHSRKTRDPLTVVFAALTELIAPQKLQRFLALFDKFGIVLDYASSESLG